MSEPKIHYDLDLRTGGTHEMTLELHLSPCGRSERQGAILSTNKEIVTCKTCLKSIESIGRVRPVNLVVPAPIENIEINMEFTTDET